MIADLKPYLAVKESGVPWVGTIPEHWQVRRLRHLIHGKLTYGANAAADYTNRDWPRYLRITDFANDGTLKADTFRSLPPEFANDCLVEEGDILLARSGATVGKSFLVTDRAGRSCHAGYLIRVRPSRAVVMPKYLFAFTQSAAFVGWKDSTFIIATIQNIAADKYADLPVPLPPLPEQAAIVLFLEHADRRIRRYIRAKQKLIKLLEDQKQAIIHHAVTRGLDPNVRLKPSGLEWLRDVPEHWEIRRNGRLFAQRKQTGYADLPILEVSLKTGVRVRDFKPSDRKQVMTDREKYKRAAAGDIAYNMMRMWQGAVGVVPVDGLVSPAYVVAKALSGAEPRYFALLFRIPAYMGEVDKYSRGIVKDRNRLYWEDFKQIPSCYPPFPEQVAIADAISELSRDINVAVDEISREISLVREYRTRLVADVVTGKLDVREAAARLPDELQEREPVDDADAETDVEEEATESASETTEEVEA